MSGSSEHRFYGGLAHWWPLLSPPNEYEEEAAYAARLLRSASIPARTVLELGSGGGHNASHLKASFTMTLVDLSDAMLDVSRALNPECMHVSGDMRSVRLETLFDAVFIHDAIDYMTTESDLRRAMETAFVHARPGGTVVIIPDHTRETFREESDSGGIDGEDGRGARYLAWTWDPDPSDTTTVTEFAFLLRERGAVEVVHETHRHGLFAREVWLHLLREVGFTEARHVAEETDEDRPPRDVFVASKRS